MSSCCTPEQPTGVRDHEPVWVHLHLNLSAPGQRAVVPVHEGVYSVPFISLISPIHGEAVGQLLALDYPERERPSSRQPPVAAITAWAPGIPKGSPAHLGRPR
jgi:hypothetical protein